jgi:S-ribosylhomocysteine lyase LuxS involved in autoinducer biosynthesis
MRDWLNIEDESYKDVKINKWDVRFPSHNDEKLNGEVHIWNLNDVKEK